MVHESNQEAVILKWSQTYPDSSRCGNSPQGQKKRERERERRTLRADTPPRAVPHMSTQTESTQQDTRFIPRPRSAWTTEVLSHPVITGVVHSFIPPGQPYHSTGYEEGRGSSLFQTRPFTYFACSFAAYPKLFFPAFSQV